MVLTKQELSDALRKEVRILLHLAGKLEGAHCEYRPTPKQRSGIELLRYLSVMGPQLMAMARRGSFDADAWKTEVAAADMRNLDQTMAVIAKQPESYDQMLADMTDDDFRSDMTSFDGSTMTRGAFIVALVLGGYAAYRTQLFLYLKACGQEHLGTTNLWAGIDAMARAS